MQNGFWPLVPKPIGLESSDLAVGAEARLVRRMLLEMAHTTFAYRSHDSDGLLENKALNRNCPIVVLVLEGRTMIGPQYSSLIAGLWSLLVGGA